MFDDFDVDEDNNITYHDMPIKRVWLQGVIVAHSGGLVLDDGTGALRLHTERYRGPVRPQHSMYATIIGTILAQETGVMIGVQQIVNLSDDPNRETLWNLEVVDIANKFYPLAPS